MTPASASRHSSALLAAFRRPRTALTRYGVRVTCLSFCPDAPVLVCGADDGSLTVYSVASVCCSEAVPPDQEARRLEAALQASVYQQLAG